MGSTSRTQSWAGSPLSTIRGSIDLALQHYRQAFVVACQAYPKGATEKNSLASDFELLVRNYYELSYPTDSARSWRKSLELRRSVRSDDPTNQRASTQEAEALEWLGDLEMQLVNGLIGYALCNQCVEAKKKLSDDAPNDHSAKRATAFAYEYQGNSSFLVGEIRNAEAAYAGFIAVREGLKYYPSKDVDGVPGIVAVYYYPGLFRYRLGDTANSFELLGKALERARSLSTASPDDPDTQRTLILVLSEAGDAHLDRNHTASAHGLPGGSKDCF